MSLIKKPEMTPEKLAANQANAQLSRGPVTPEGLERARQASVRHGFYSLNFGEGLRALGEDPEEFSKLLRLLGETWHPSGEFEFYLVTRLARAIWRLHRADRMQEAMAVSQLKSMDAAVDRLARHEGAAYEKKMAGLKALLDAAGRADFATSQVEIDTLAAACGGELEGHNGEILLLLCRLAKENLASLALPPADGVAIKPGADLAAAEGAERENLRERLLALLHEEKQALEEACAERGQEFAFTRTEPAGGTIRWFYRFEPGPGGTTAELGYQVLRPVPVFLHLSLRALFGVRDLRADLHQNMATSLQKFARIAERQAQQAHASGRD